MLKPEIYIKKEHENPDMEKIKISIGDIIITKHEVKEYENEKGEHVKKRIPVKVNITRKVTENAKLVKDLTAEEKLKMIEKISTK